MEKLFLKQREEYNGCHIDTCAYPRSLWPSPLFLVMARDMLFVDIAFYCEVNQLFWHMLFSQNVPALESTSAWLLTTSPQLSRSEVVALCRGSRPRVELWLQSCVPAINSKSLLLYGVVSDVSAPTQSLLLKEQLIYKMLYRRSRLLLHLGHVAHKEGSQGVEGHYSGAHESASPLQAQDTPESRNRSGSEQEWVSWQPALVNTRKSNLFGSPLYRQGFNFHNVCIWTVT